MRCPKCNTNNNTDAQFCENCGDKLKVDVHSALDREILNIIEVNSFSKSIFAAYKAQKIANKISKENYGKENYKKYVEMLMVKHFPKELEKVRLGRKCLLWFWISIAFVMVSFWFGILVLIISFSVSALIIWKLVIPAYKKLKEIC
jgi:hypothetical protein